MLFRSLSDSELDFVMMHEILHVVLQHCFRGDVEDPEAYNKDEKWTEIIGGMTIYKDAELKAYLEQAGFHKVQIHKKKNWLCVTARK